VSGVGFYSCIMRFAHEILCVLLLNFRLRFPYEIVCFLLRNFLTRFAKENSCFFGVTRCPYEICRIFAAYFSDEIS
jgi:hypothetical protein